MGWRIFWGMAYADDVVFLSPSASGIRLMLRVCEDFASSHSLLFNPFKIMFIKFYHHSHLRMNSSILFCGSYLPLLNEVLHLGHILTYNLSDDHDILSKCKDMIRKANSLLCSFSNLSPLSSLTSFVPSAYRYMGVLPGIFHQNVLIR